MSIELSPSQVPFLNELHDLIGKVEKETVISVDHTNGDEVAWHLMRRIELQHHTPRIMELATAIYNHCKGLAAAEAMSDERILSLKQDVQRKWFDGRLSKWDALYAKCERLCKDLANGIEGMRSLLSMEKELMRTRITDSGSTHIKIV